MTTFVFSPSFFVEKSTQNGGKKSSRAKNSVLQSKNSVLMYLSQKRGEAEKYTVTFF